ncbi:MAG: hypothetical protein JWQ49_1424 [Edaphobacter sp.]|nr:hypothetical protein [Edaphobacter sp.]
MRSESEQLDVSWPITAVDCPQPPYTHCSDVQAITRSTRGRFAGNVWRPGCLRFFLSGVAGSASRSPSAATSRLLTPGSSSNSSNCWLVNLSLPGPYFAIRCRRSLSSSNWTRSSESCSRCDVTSNCCFSCSMISASEGVREVVGVDGVAEWKGAFTMSID